MTQIQRREFLAATALTGATFILGRNGSMAADAKRLMTIDFRGGSIGVRVSQPEAVKLASKHGFESVEPQAGFLGKLTDAELDAFLATLRERSLVFGAAGLPVNFWSDEKSFQNGLRALPGAARALQRAGVTRIGTWIMPFNSRLTYLKNFKLHATRLRQVATILVAHGLRLGLEYVGPKTMWTRGLFPFIHTMAETRELIEAIGVKGVGFVLDSWHWYHARETAADILSLKNADIVAVDLNDAPADIPIDEQVDNRRELPAATGVIDLAAFLNALNKIGYDGPVRAEPFNAALRKMSAEDATAATARAMKKAFALIE